MIRNNTVKAALVTCFGAVLAVSSVAYAIAAPAFVGNAAAVGAATLSPGTRDFGPLAGSSRVEFSVVLPYQHAADLSALLAAQSDPNSKVYHRFLSAAGFRAYFSPTQATYNAAAAKLRAAGLRVETFANRTVLHAVGPATAAASLFRTRIDAVREASGRFAYANVSAATLPAELLGSRVIGLNGEITAQTAVRHGRRAAIPNAGYGGKLFGPDSGFGPAVLAQDEDMPVVHGYRGKNTNVADVIDGSVTDSDVATFLTYFGIARHGPRTTAIHVDGGCGAGCADSYSAEVVAEWILALAPDASLFTYQIQNLTDGALIDGFNQIVSDDAVNIVNSAIGSCELNNADLQLGLAPILAQGAAEGISVETVAYGGADPCGLGINLTMTPANLPTVTAVGGSTATVNTSGRLTSQSALLDTNGGVSATVPLPAWQAKTAGIGHGGRNVPDIVLPGSVNGVGPSVYAQGQWQGGTAFANNAPFAGYLASVQQYYGYAMPLGNIAPALYAAFDAHAYATDSFADITTGNIGTINGIPVSAKPGYDHATGIGTIGSGYTLMKALGYTPASP